MRHIRLKVRDTYFPGTVTVFVGDMDGPKEYEHGFNATGTLHIAGELIADDLRINGSDPANFSQPVVDSVMVSGKHLYAEYAPSSRDVDSDNVVVSFDLED
ncbi:hypothetical protein OAU50_03305 [Planctomycetota bacterium]|nr:hypothetical protein [Planctomycetota bacterium]